MNISKFIFQRYFDIITIFIKLFGIHVFRILFMYYINTSYENITNRYIFLI